MPAPPPPPQSEEAVADAISLLQGTGLTPQPKRAAMILCEAARAGSGAAAALLAVLKGSGVGVHQSWAEALDYVEVAARLGDRSTQEQLALLIDDKALIARITASEFTGPELWTQVRQSVDLKPWMTSAPMGLLSHSPRVVILPRFISLPVCHWLIRRGEENPQPALIYDGETGVSRPDLLRTNTVSRFGIVNSDLIILLVQAKITAATGFLFARMEGVNILRYDVGQEFADHVDFLDPNVPRMKAEMDVLGQRVATFLIYLNDGFEGGETDFPAAGLRYRGKAGDAMLFFNVDPDGSPDPNSRHAGLPPTSGRKWLLSQWIRDQPQLIA